MAPPPSPPPPHPTSTPTFFVPDSLSRLARTAIEASTTGEGGAEPEETRLYAWGRRKGGAAVVVGVSRAQEGLEKARERLRKLQGRRGSGGKGDEAEGELLAELRPRAVPEEGAFPTFDLVPLSSASSSASPLSPTTSSTSSTSVTPITPILYSPLKHLEVLALEPLGLDFHPTPTAEIASPPTMIEGIEEVLEKRRPGRREEVRDRRIVENAVGLINSSRSCLASSSAPSTNSCLDPLFRLFSPLLAAFTSFLTIAIAVLSYRIPVLGSLAERTAIGRQLHTRFSQTLSLAPTYTSFRRQLRSPHASASSGGSAASEATHSSAHASYIRFFNLLWLIANDMIVGFALGSFLRDNAPYLARVLEVAIKDHALTSLRSMLDWLNSWPMGVKLNDELAGVICSAFHFLSRVWEDLILTPLLPSLPHLLTLLSLTGSIGLGASALLALTTDLLSLLVLPFTLCYVLAAAGYRWSLVALGGLFNVFRGKKYNPLRNRVEPATYEVDNLLLGTILFVTLIFLFPTVLAFYLAFLSARLATLSLYTFLSLGVASLNAFPLFALMLRVKAPGRLPGGVKLEYCKDKRCWGEAHLHLRNQPLSFLAILSSLSRNLNDLLNLRSAGLFLHRICNGNLV